MLGTPTKSVHWILLVEDDVKGADAFASALKDAGFRVVHAQSVQEASAKLRMQKFSCVVLDLHLSRGNGEQVVAAMRTSRSINEETPVLVVSGFLDPAAIQRLKPMVQGMVVKPIGLEAFLNRVKVTIETPVMPVEGKIKISP